MGSVFCSLLHCSGWEDEGRNRLLEYFQFLFIKGKRATGLVVVVFFSVLNCGIVSVKMLLILPVPTGIPLTVHKPLKQKSTAKSTVFLCGYVGRACRYTGLCS